MGDLAYTLMALNKIKPHQEKQPTPIHSLLKRMDLQKREGRENTFYNGICCSISRDLGNKLLGKVIFTIRIDTKIPSPSRTKGYQRSRVNSLGSSENHFLEHRSLIPLPQEKGTPPWFRPHFSLLVGSVFKPCSETHFPTPPSYSKNSSPRIHSSPAHICIHPLVSTTHHPCYKGQIRVKNWNSLGMKPRNEKGIEKEIKSHDLWPVYI